MLPAPVAPKEKDSFRLLDLPTELCIIIYKLQSIEKSEHIFMNSAVEGHNYKFKMNTPPTSVNVYTTCRQVNTEVFSPMANNLAELSPLPRVIVEVESLRFIHCDYGRLWFVSVHLLLVARDRDNNGEIDLSDAMVFALKRAENWMDGKVLGLVACMQKWFVLFERKRLLAGQHSTLDSVPTVVLPSPHISYIQGATRSR